jgi:hypothetical protein
MKYLFIALAGYVLISHFDRAVFPKPSLNGRAVANWTSTVNEHPPITAAGIGGDVNAPDIADIKRCCDKIIGDYQRIFFLQDRNGKMKLQLRGVYAHGAALFFLLRLNNRSPLDYDVDSIRGRSRSRPSMPMTARRPFPVTAGRRISSSSPGLPCRRDGSCLSTYRRRMAAGICRCRLPI